MDRNIVEMFYLSCMKRILLFALLVLFSLGSCKKGKADFTLKGTITDATFATGLSGASVKLYATEVGSLTIDQIASGTLNANGEYSFTFPRDKIETYYLEVTKDNYFEVYEAIPFSELTISEDNVYNFSTTAKGWVKFHIVNNNGQASDVLEYIREEGKVDCAECCPGGYRYYYGAVDTTFYCVNDGNKEYSGYYWEQGGGASGPVWVITPPFDTVNVNISY